MTTDGASWQYRDNKGGWVTFSKKDGDALEASFIANPNAVVPLKLGAYAYSFDLGAMTQKNLKTDKERDLKRTSSDGTVRSREAVWEWESSHHDHKYTAYGAKTNEIIEAAFQKNSLLTRVNLPVSAHDTKPFVIHFGHMHQHPEDDAAAVRTVRRAVRVVERQTNFNAPLSAASSTGAVPKPTIAVDDTVAVTPKTKAKRSRTPDKASTATSAAAAPRAEVAGVPLKVPVQPEKFEAPTVGQAVPAATDLGMRAWKTMHHSMLALPAHAPAPGAVLRIAAFDMDDTLIRPKSMDAKKKKYATFAKSAEDWDWLHPSVPERLRQLHSSGYLVIIISNQGGIAKDASKAAWVKSKILALQDAAKTPISFIAATAEDANRKPGLAMWDAITNGLFAAPNLTIEYEHSFYCGDAAGRIGYTTLAGREKDFSCSDRKFAFNIGIRFFTPEQWLVGKPPASHFGWEGFGPEDLEKLATAQHPAGASYHAPHQELVIMVGWPGSGKSTFYEQHLKPHGYIHANRDTLKTLDKVCAVAKDSLAAGKSVCVDNTSPEAATRAMYIKLAHQFKVPARIFHIQTNRATAWHLNLVRAQLGLAERVSSVAYNIYQGKFEEPNPAKEGAEVIKVPLVPNTAQMSNKAKRFMLQCLT
jgi:bifunctional polynucleotide phosphatase/kinase